MVCFVLSSPVAATAATNQQLSIETKLVIQEQINLLLVLLKNLQAQLLTMDNASIKTETSLPSDPISTKIDLLSYFLKTDSNQKVALANSSQDFYWHQVKSGNDFYLEKWNNPSQIVHYRYDNDKIYLITDSTGAHPYKFTPGIWANRFMKIGESIDMSSNSMQTLTNECHQTQAKIGWPYRTIFEARYPTYDLGGDLGIKDVIVIKYDWGSGFNNTEREYYAKDYGIVKWEHTENGMVKQSVLTNKIFKYTFNAPKPLCYDLSGNWQKPPPPPPPAIPTTLSDLTKHLYSCVLNNPTPDQSGLDYWTSNLRNKTLSIPQVYTYMYGYQTGLSNDEFVTNLYSCILFHAPDSAGYDYWLTILNKGQDTRENQVQYFLNSSGFTSSILPQLQSLIP